MNSPEREIHLKNILNKTFNLDIVRVNRLVGYANLNYQVTDTSGNKFVCKEYPATHYNSELYFAESTILQQLAEYQPEAFQKPVKTNDDEFFCESIHDDAPVFYRILTWLEGGLFADAGHTPGLFKSFGRFLAGMDKEMIKMDSFIIRARHIEWDLQYFTDIREKIGYIQDPGKRKIVDYYFLHFREFVIPELHGLRKSIIHNDANDRNVLVKNGKVAGIIDFGDMVYAPLVQELAVALAYAIFGKDDPLKWAAYIIEGYNEILPLELKELELLYYLIAARLCMSVILSSEGIKNNPENKYLLISQKPAWDLLHRWIAISPDMAEKRFKEAAGIVTQKSPGIQHDLKKRYRYISKALSVSYTKPIKMKRAAFQYMFDADGNTFLDAYNNIPHVGHQHPRVVEAGQKQMAVLNTNTRYLYDQLADYAERLISKFPSSLNKVFFVNSGSAASDLAIRLAQTLTGNQNIVVMEHGYHGHTRLGVDISHYKFGNKGGAGRQDIVTVLPIPDTYRGKYRNNDGTAGREYTRNAVDIIDENETPPAAFIAEPVVGCGGQVPLARDYLKTLYPEISKRGGVCISDEVQTGFGRIGTHYWGFEMHGVIPDIVVLGKPMGNGHPIGAVVTTSEIAESFDNGMEFFSSFGGNPVSCAVGMAVLDVIDEEGLRQNALETGEHFMNLLRDIQKEFPVIGDVRGSGLFLGVELIKKPETLEPNTEMAQFLKNKLRENFILVSTDGPFDNVIKMKPPMCFDKSNADRVAGSIRKLLMSC